jgi:uncharacterized membrane protein
MARHPRWVRRVFTGPELDELARAVARAERLTSGELRVHLERRVPRDREGRVLAPLTRARDVFAGLGMARTAQRNGVLIYLALDDHALAIVGDEAVHARLGDAYWQRVRDLMVERLRAGRPAEAVLGAVDDVGRVLAEHFPPRPDDVDELPDRLSTS